MHDVKVSDGTKVLELELKARNEELDVGETVKVVLGSKLIQVVCPDGEVFYLNRTQAELLSNMLHIQANRLKE